MMKVERVDDLPLLIAEMTRAGLPQLIAQYFPDHGNWSGLEGGKVTVALLTYILSQGDHRLSHLEQWAAQRLHTLSRCLDAPGLSAKDLTDDKLGILLDKFADQTRWDAFEAAYNQGLIRVFELNATPPTTRLDAFVAPSHRSSAGDFRQGYSNHHQGHLPQLKVMTATLDPLALPLCSVIAAGNTADDSLYLPLIEKLLGRLPSAAQLFVGDSKMGKSEVRTLLAERGHYYLMPLNRKQCTAQTLAQELRDQPTEQVEWYQTDQRGGEHLKARAFERVVQLPLDGPAGGHREERRIFVLSAAHAEDLARVQEKRLHAASRELDGLFGMGRGKKHVKTAAEAWTKINGVLAKHDLEGLVEVELHEEVTQREVRGHLNRPTRVEQRSIFRLTYRINQPLVAERLESRAWQVYGCNAPVDLLDTRQVLLCYRNQYRIEHKFDELLNRLTALLPMYLKKESRVKSLVRLLLLALKHSTLLEYRLRRGLASQGGELRGLYAGNPGRRTSQPTTAMLLRAFRGVSLVIRPGVGGPVGQLTELSELQVELLALVGQPPDLYISLADMPEVVTQIRET